VAQDNDLNQKDDMSEIVDFIRRTRELMEIEGQTKNKILKEKNREINEQIHTHIANICHFINNIDLELGSNANNSLKFIYKKNNTILKNVTKNLVDIIDEIKNLENQEDLPLTEIKFDRFFTACNNAYIPILNIYTIFKTENNIYLAEKYKENISKIEEEAKKSAGIIVDADLSLYFEKTKNDFWVEWVFWLLCILTTTYILVSGIVYFDKGFSAIHVTLKDFMTNDIIVYSYYLGRLGFMALFLIILFFTFKHLNIASHNRISYGYKAVIMKTLPAIWTQYPEAKKEIFIEKLADFIFKNQDTGINKNTDSGMPYEKVFDLFLKASGKGKD